MIPDEIRESVILQLSKKFTAGKISIHSSEPLSGGCINHVHKLNTSSGSYCIKYNLKAEFPGMFESESEGLKTLADTGEIRVPTVIMTGNSSQYAYIILEYIQSGIKIDRFMEDFGRSLARLHRHSSGSFGFDHDNYMGALPQSNRKHQDWPSFFREERIEKQVSIAVQKGYLSDNDLLHLDNLYNRVDDLFPQEPPSLIHGDLWGGNYMVSDEGKACLIDPAVYWGHREIDLAMTTLFGGFSSDFYKAYGEEYPLAKGWKERLKIYNLYPLLIHLNLFGTGYLGSVREIIRLF